jgi:hypothetical protein
VATRWSALREPLDQDPPLGVLGEHDGQEAVRVVERQQRVVDARRAGASSSPPRSATP